MSVNNFETIYYGLFKQHYSALLFYATRLAEGNAVIGAWLKVYKKSDVVRTTVGQRANRQAGGMAETGNLCFYPFRPQHLQ